MTLPPFRFEDTHTSLGWISVDARILPARMIWRDQVSNTGLMMLREDETRIDAGRFAFFTRAPQVHEVAFLFVPQGWAWDGMNARTTSFVDWISRNVSDQWSLRMDMASGYAGKHIFSFAEHDVATLLYLRFA